MHTRNPGTVLNQGKGQSVSLARAASSGRYLAVAAIQHSQGNHYRRGYLYQMQMASTTGTAMAFTSPSREGENLTFR